MEINDAVQSLQSLAQETRLRVFRCLVQAGPGGMSAGDVGQAVGVSPSTLSFHLNHLTQAGLIARRRDGRTLWYSVRFDHVGELLTYLMEDCCRGMAGPGAPVEPCCESATKEPVS